MPPTIANPALSVKDLIEANWDPTKAHDITPEFHTSWFRNEAADKAQLSVNSSIPEAVVVGGNTGITAIRGDGSGHVQLRGTVLHARAWAPPDLLDGGSAVINPKDLAYAMMQEVGRIITALGDTLTEFEYVTFGTTVEGIDREAEPPLIWRDIFINYGWLRTPV